MADKKEIKDIIGKFHANPKLLDDLLDAGKQERGNKLKAHGADKLNRKEVREVMEQLLTTPDAGSPARLVEWVGAIATAAAGAAAA